MSLLTSHVQKKRDGSYVITDENGATTTATRQELQALRQSEKEGRKAKVKESKSQPQPKS